MKRLYSTTQAALVTTDMPNTRVSAQVPAHRAPQGERDSAPASPFTLTTGWTTYVEMKGGGLRGRPLHYRLCDPLQVTTAQRGV